MEKLNTAWRRLRRGNVSARAIALETQRRIRVAFARRGERASLTALNEKPAQLTKHFAGLSAPDLLDHFRSRTSPSFFPGFASAEQTAALQAKLFPEETTELLEGARGILSHSTSLIGIPPRGGYAETDWHCDPLTGKQWPLSFHSDIQLVRNDGSDVRVIWELNRLGHLITLGRAFAITKNEDFSKEFFLELTSWQAQNPVGRGVNWSCAMEVALRAMNLLGAFALFVQSSGLKEGELRQLLKIFDQHGAHIKRNLEFSYFGTSNHYLSDVVGLLWLGVMLPELEAAKDWRDWAFREMLREMDKQILPDGADYEGSTGYHCFVLELFLYSFLLCRNNGISIEDKYWRQLHLMLEYLRAILRPDGLVPLVGDTDGSQALPITARRANDRAHLLALGAVAFKDSKFKPPSLEVSPELLWVLGEEGLRNYEQLAYSNAEPSSQAFPNAGTYLLRHEDLYLLFNAGGPEKGRPASHRHNDLLSIEVSAGGRAFIVDPGSYVYTADLHERHLFRSTSYHSTVQIDDEEQQTIIEEAPFVIGGGASARVFVWESTAERVRVAAQHFGYQRLPEPVTHRRVITFSKPDRCWLIEDELLGKGQHKVATRFHFDAGLDIELFDNNGVKAGDEISGARLIVRSLDLDQPAELQTQFTSRHYGSKVESVTACWTTNASLPCKLRWLIGLLREGEDPKSDI